MKAFIINKYSKNGALQLADVPVPELKDNDVLVDVYAAGVKPFGF
ncbi:hypothetical protein [Flavobacterium sp. 81]|nr:hypothetical protein [Flavobacterium sp. 81]